jgi:hypothetical protein
MRTILILLIITFSLNLTYSQEDTLLYVYQNELLKQVDEYNKPNKLVRNSLFNEKINEIMNHIVFGSSDKVINSNSIGFILNEEKTNLVTSINFPLNNKGLILKTGLFTSGESNLFNLYSENSWNNNVGFNIGFIKKINSSISFNEVKHQKKDVKRYRLFYVDSLLKSKKKLNLKNLCLIEEKLKFIDTSYTVKHNGVKSCKVLSLNIKDSIKNQITKKGRITVFDSIKKLIEDYSLYLIKPNIKKLVDNELKAFDKRFDRMSGYSLKWLDFNLSGINSTYNIPNDSILTKEVLEANKLQKFSRKFNVEISANWNYLSNKRKLHYIQAGISFKKGNFLNNNLVVGTPKIKELNNEFILIDEDENELGFYKNLNINNTFGSLYFLYSGFYNKKKSIGLKFDFKHNYLLSKNDFFKKNFTLLVGPIFRNINADNINKGTFGLEIGFENDIYNTKISDNFIARLTLGIPFEVFSKKVK